MCGIAGFFSPHHKADFDRQGVLQSLRHRGPDGDGVFEGENFVFLHTLLKIQDLSDAARQPFTDRENVLVFNGEIYNFIELRKTLEKNRGIGFLTNTDTEVLFYGLREYGLDFLKELRGDFAFAFYSRADEQIWIARDRFGVKPLYYSLSGGGLYFSSEIRGLTAMGVAKEVCRKEFNSYLGLRYTVGEKTVFRGIKRLEPAHVMVVDRAQNASIRRYWSPFDGNGKQASIEELARELRRAVDFRLRSQAPIGMLLSGGMDSSLLFKLGVERKKITHAWTCLLEHSSLSRRDHALAAEFARNFRVPHSTYVHRESHFDEALHAIEEPIGDAIIGPLHGLIGLASTKSKVLISGEGADEVFFGYGHHYYFGAKERLRRYHVDLFADLIGRILFRFGRLASVVYPARISLEEERRISENLRMGGSFSASYHHLIEVFNYGDRLKILGDDAIDLAPETERILNAGAALSPIKRLLYLEIQTWLCNYNLLKLDKITGHFSAEGRVPYLDHHFVELLFALPDEFFWKFLERKPLMGLLCERESVRKVRKVPFTDPKPMEAPELMNMSAIEDYFSPKEPLEKLWQGRGLLAGKKKLSLFLLNRWLELHCA